MRIAVLLLLAVAACSSQPRPTMYSYWHRSEAAKIKPGGPAGQSYVADTVDGSYQGIAYLTSAPNLRRGQWWHTPHINDAVCPGTSAGVVEVGDHVMAYSYSPNLIFKVQLTDGGSFTQSIGAATLSGTLKHGRLVFNVVTPLCTTRFFGGYKLNHS